MSYSFTYYPASEKLLIRAMASCVHEEFIQVWTTEFRKACARIGMNDEDQEAFSWRHNSKLYSQDCQNGKPFLKVPNMAFAVKYSPNDDEGEEDTEIITMTVEVAFSESYRHAAKLTSETLKHFGVPRAVLVKITERSTPPKQPECPARCACFRFNRHRNHPESRHNVLKDEATLYTTDETDYNTIGPFDGVGFLTVRLELWDAVAGRKPILSQAIVPRCLRHPSLQFPLKDLYGSAENVPPHLPVDSVVMMATSEFFKPLKRAAKKLVKERQNEGIMKRKRTS